MPPNEQVWSAKHTCIQIAKWLIIRYQYSYTVHSYSSDGSTGLVCKIILTKEIIYCKMLPVQCFIIIMLKLSHNLTGLFLN